MKQEERSGNAVDNDVFRDITGNNPWQIAGEITSRMEVSHSIVVPLASYSRAKENELISCHILLPFHYVAQINRTLDNYRIMEQAVLQLNYICTYI